MSTALRDRRKETRKLKQVPRSQDLVQLVQADKIGMFHKSWAPGHGSTNYTRYYDAAPGEVYRVQGYTHSYEPYVIYKKEGSPWCVSHASLSAELPPYYPGS